MLKKLALVFAMLAMATVAGANTFSADGTVFEATHGYTFNNDRVLVNDGSFEAGCDVNWTCVTDNGCAWIADLVPLGLWNYDGNMVAWLGGFCGGLATCFTNICQDILIDGPELTVFWMAYVSDEVGHIYISIEGDIVFDYTPNLADHLLDYQQWTFDTGGHFGMATFCLNLDNPDCSYNEGDNVFLDYVETVVSPSAIEDVSLSTVKSLY